MISVTESGGMPIDCRCLIMHVSFFALPEECARGIAREYIRFIDEHLGEKCVIRWESDKRKIKDPYDHLETTTHKLIYYSGEGCVKSDSIKDLKAYNRYEKSLEYGYRPKFITYDIPDNHSIANLDCDYSDPEDIKRGVLYFFNEQKGEYLRPLYRDISLFFSANRQYFEERYKEGDLYAGSYYISISLYSIFDELDIWINRFERLIQKQMTDYLNVNGYIELSERPGYYSYHFGTKGHMEYGLIKKRDVWNFIDDIYFTDIGFSHFICKDTLCLGMGISKELFNDYLECVELPNNGLKVECRKHPLEIGLDDLKAIKRKIYSTVYPRSDMRRFLDQLCDLRRNWQWIPVFDDEVTATCEGVRLTHHGSLNIEQLQDMLKIKM